MAYFLNLLSSSMPLFGCPATFCISEIEIEPHGKRSLTSRFKATQLISTQPSLKLLNTISQPDFDRLTLYVAVASELRKEPFVSEDNPPEKLTPSNDGQFCAHFGHPAFLKSALVPFRKLWLGSEQCAFEKVRDRIFEVHPDRDRIPAERFVFSDIYAQNLNASPASDWASESTKDILNIWIYTQGIHAGQLEDWKGRIIRPDHPTLRDFDDFAKRIGREKFEFLFRLSLRSIGGFYIQFLTKIAEPFYWNLRRAGMVPGFEANAALQHNPYPDPQSRITFDDVFWHLNKESMEETFDRLLTRASYSGMKCILRAFFRDTWPSSALAAVCEAADFSAFLGANGARILDENENIEAFPCGAVTNSASPFGVIRIEVYPERQMRLSYGTAEIFSRIYEDFRNCLFAERKSQRPRKREYW